MVHMDVKKIGKLRDGGGWWAHGRGSVQDKKKHSQRIAYTYLHSIIDGFSRLAYTEALEDEKAATTIAFFHRARAFIGRHQRTRIYTPRHNGKVERYQRIMTDECLDARAYDSENERREAIVVWVHQYGYHRATPPSGTDLEAGHVPGAHREVRGGAGWGVPGRGRAGWMG